MDTEQLHQTRSVSAKWQERFDHFQHLESLDDAGKKTAVKSLGLRKSVRVNFNFIAFFFGFVYLFVLGLWRRNLAMTGITILAYLGIGVTEVILDIEISDTVDRGLGLAFSCWYAGTANVAYYLKEVKGYNGWNPFKFSA